MQVRVTITGPQGAGKTQVGAALAALLKQNGVKVQLRDDNTTVAVQSTAQLHLPKETDVAIQVKEALA